MIALGFIATGYALPRVVQSATEITPTSVRIVRPDGFYSTVSYVRDDARGTESVHASTLALRNVHVDYSAACSCIKRFTHYSGVTVYTVFVYPERSEAFYMLGVHDTTDGIPQHPGTTIPISKAGAEIAQAQSVLDEVRKRFANLVPKT